MNFDLFPTMPGDEKIALGVSTFLLPGYALAHVGELLDGIRHIEQDAPFRRMVTPGGFQMSVALTNCGKLGWITDRRGYRYSATDPETGRPWPAMPAGFRGLARRAAEAAGFADFRPDACLVNRYLAGTRMSLHQDKDEQDLNAPIVSVSLGMPAMFQLGGSRRSDPVTRVALNHGDVVVWGATERLRFHGISPVKANPHEVLGEVRLNLTFRKAT